MSVELYDVKQAAECLRSSETTIRRFIALGELPVRRQGRRVYVTRRAIEKFLERDHDSPKIYR